MSAGQITIAVSTGEIAIAASAALLLAALFTALIWRGVVVVSLSIRVIPPWNRHAPQKKVTTTNVVAGAADEAPASATVQITERQRGAA